MIYQLNLLNSSLSPSCLEDQIICASEYSCYDFVIGSGQIDEAKKASSKVNLICQIGGPLGQSLKKIREIEVLLACKKGISAVEVVIPACDINDNKFTKINNEVAVYKGICQEYNTQLGITIESKFSSLVDIGSLIKTISPDYFATSTGFFDICMLDESILLYKLKQEFPSTIIIPTLPYWKKDFTKITKHIPIESIRLNSIEVLETTYNKV